MASAALHAGFLLAALQHGRTPGPFPPDARPVVVSLLAEPNGPSPEPSPALLPWRENRSRVPAGSMTLRAARHAPPTTPSTDLRPTVSLAMEEGRPLPPAVPGDGGPSPSPAPKRAGKALPSSARFLRMPGTPRPAADLLTSRPAPLRFDMRDRLSAAPLPPELPRLGEEKARASGARPAPFRPTDDEREGEGEGERNGHSSGLRAVGAPEEDHGSVSVGSVGLEADGPEAAMSAIPAPPGMEEGRTGTRPVRYRRVSPPPYPPLARRLGYEGEVLVRVLIDEDGIVTDALLDHRSPHAILDDAALRAVRLWEFEPAYREGKRVPSEVVVPVRFLLR